MGEEKLEFKVNESSDAITMIKNGKEYTFPAVICDVGSREKLKKAYEELGINYVP